MGHLRRLGGRWSALGGARRPRPAPAAAHRPCRSPGPHPAHSGPRTTAQAATRGQIRPPWAQIGWLQRACHGHVSVVCGHPTCPRGPGAVLRAPRGHARWSGVLGRPWGGSRPVVGSVSVHTSFLSDPRSFLSDLVFHIGKPVPQEQQATASHNSHRRQHPCPPGGTRQLVPTHGARGTARSRLSGRGDHPTARSGPNRPVCTPEPRWP